MILILAVAQFLNWPAYFALDVVIGNEALYFWTQILNTEYNVAEAR
jgi:hypothetical protein